MRPPDKAVAMATGGTGGARLTVVFTPRVLGSGPADVWGVKTMTWARLWLRSGLDRSAVEPPPPVWARAAEPESSHMLKLATSLAL